MDIHCVDLVIVAFSLFLVGCSERHDVSNQERNRDVFIEFEGRKTVLVDGERMAWEGRTTGWRIHKAHSRARRFWFKNVSAVMFEDLWALTDYLRPENDNTCICFADFGIIDPSVGECPFDFHRRFVEKDRVVFEMHAEDYCLVGVVTGTLLDGLAQYPTTEFSNVKVVNRSSAVPLMPNVSLFCLRLQA